MIAPSSKRFVFLLPSLSAWGVLLGLMMAVNSSLFAAGPFAITEFMAANSTTLNDEDGDNSDWIEIQNTGTTNASLAGWSLTDTTNNLMKWLFPATNLPPSGYLVVFASEKNRQRAGAPLHTNFKLGTEGEYLGLVDPNGAIASQFAPLFPPQVEDVSYGIVRASSPVSLLSAGAPVRALVPANNELGLAWTELGFNDASWTNGVSGVGYDRQAVGVNFLPFIGLNVESLMFNLNASIYARVPFQVGNPEELVGLTLRLKFEDGFIAYLNGQEIARSNAPLSATWNSAALGPRTDTAATNFLDFDISAFRGSLLLGSNVLAFHALNNPINSPDLLLVPELTGLTSSGVALPRYFTTPTPGRPNNSGVESLGPIITAAEHTPAMPQDDENIVVTARLRPAFAPVASATLVYRTMFAASVSIDLRDDGLHGDGASGDGIYGATIPALAAGPGQMVRWYFTATDTTGTNVSRLPSFVRADAPAYFGTVVQNPALSNALPVFHWFVQDVPPTDTFTGTHASVFWNGEFYDNIFCRVRGASAPSFPKKPYKFDFNPGEHFRFLPDAPRVEEINLNATYQDKAYLRQPLTYDTYRDAGVPSANAFNVRVQQNGAFFSVAVLTEQLDETFLERRSLDPNGALYKIYNGIDSSTSGVEKKTRRLENNNDLQQLVSAVNLSNPNRGTAIFDVLDLPEIVNYLAAGTVAQDWDRVVKNIYVYRDTEGTGLWQMFPWDKDLSFGKVGLVNDTVTAIRDGTDRPGGGEPYFSHPFYGIPERNCCGMNHLFDAIYKTPVTREMYLRRLRTLMDELLQPPGTAPNQRLYETRVDQIATALRNDAALDLARWGAGYGVVQSLATAISALKDEYLAPRRVHLYQTHSVDNVGLYPPAVGIPHAQVGSPELRFGVVEFSPSSGQQGQEYVELLNPNPVAVDISGWRIEGGIEFVFSPGTVVPAHGRVYLSPDLVAFRTRLSGPRAGQGLFAVGNYQGQLSARGETLRLLDERGAGIATNSYPGNPSAVQRFLRVAELMYHATPAVGGGEDDFDYIELRNISTNTTLDLRGVRFSTGIDFNFTAGAVTNLAPGARVLVVGSVAAFLSRYGGSRPVAGEYVGALDNDGERLQLLDASGEEVLDFTYADGWYPITDGLGFSLVIRDENATPESWNEKSQWRPSATPDGAPGTADPLPPTIAPILVNEVLSRTDTPPPTDTVELFNPTANGVNVSGWFLSDDFNMPKKFRFPEGTLIPAYGFRLFNETNFNPVPGVSPSFSFSSFSDEAWLFSGDGQTNLTGYVHGFAFGAAENDRSFGRHVDGLGEEHFVAQAALTLGGTNSLPRVGPLVISEIMYHPLDVGTNDNRRDEFIELQNISATAVNLYNSSATQSWQLRGAVEFDFPSDVILPAGGSLLVVGFDPVSDPAALAAFRDAYGLGTSIPILGPYAGRLDNSGATIELEKPDAPTDGRVPFILVDAVHYRDVVPWPPAADGTGSSLQRRAVTAYGDDPGNWFAAGLSPGTTNSVNLAPSAHIISPSGAAVFSQPANITITAEAADTDGSISRVEFLADGLKVGERSAVPYTFTWTNVAFGSHSLRVRATDNRSATYLSDPVSVTVLAPPPTVTITSPTNGAALLAGSPIVITAAAADVDGFVASVEFFSGPNKLGEVATGPYVFMWTNAAPGNQLLSARVRDNSGLMGFSSQVAVTVVVGSATNLTLIATNAIWRYFDLGSEPTGGWTNRTYNDASWMTGLAPLGYGDGDEATVVGYGDNSSSKFITTYFRRTFVVSSADAFSSLNVRVLRDDGAIIYLNEHEVFRTGMPEGPVGYGTLANITVVDADEVTTFFGQAVDPGLLREGTNVVAAEVHQVLSSSSDISFNLELSGRQVFLAPVLTIHPAGTLSWSVQASAAVLQFTTTLREPMAWQTDLTPRTEENGRIVVAIPMTSGNRFYRLIQPVR